MGEMLDVYEFTQALRRQRRLLIIGAVLLLVGTFLLTFKPSANGLEPRIGPRYETSVRMVVTDGGIDTLAKATSGGEAMAQTAGFFQTLLMGPDAVRDIAAATGVGIHEFQATNAGAMMTVRTVADTPEGAVATAMGAYDWLTERLDEPLELIDVTPTTEAPSLLDEEGRIDAAVLLDVSPAFAEDTDLWVTMAIDGAQFKSASLADAALEDVTVPSVNIRPGSELTLQLEDVTRNQLDSIALTIPELSGPDNAPHTLHLRLDRDAVIGIETTAGAEGESPERDVSGAELVPERTALTWEVGEIAEAAPPAPASIGISLLTKDPIPLLTGARRGPVLALAALFGGAFALFALAIAVDSWKQAHRNRTANAYQDRLAIVRPLGGEGQYEGAGPLSHRLRSADERNRPPDASSGE